MEKLKLNDGTILELVPMKLDITDKLFKATVVSSLNYLELETILLNVDNISKIQHLSEADEILAIYSECVGFKTMGKDYESEYNNAYVIVLNTDKVLATYIQLNNKVNELNDQINQTINLDTCTIEELKDYRIIQSKNELESFLALNPINSNAHGENKYYSITRDKQSLLTQMIVISQLALQNNVPYQPSWNATGEPCTYDWTIEQLRQLAFEIELIVRPLISYQQELESQIKACSTKEDILNIIWDYNLGVAEGEDL